jgi:hypothetical protein
MFVEYIYIYIYEQYNFKTARQNTSKLKYFILIKKTKHLRNKIDNLEQHYVPMSSRPYLILN